MSVLPLPALWDGRWEAGWLVHWWQGVWLMTTEWGPPVDWDSERALVEITHALATLSRKLSSSHRRGAAASAAYCFVMAQGAKGLALLGSQVAQSSEEQRRHDPTRLFACVESAAVGAATLLGVLQQPAAGQVAERAQQLLLGPALEAYTAFCSQLCELVHDLPSASDARRALTAATPAGLEAAAGAAEAMLRLAAEALQPCGPAAAALGVPNVIRGQLAAACFSAAHELLMFMESAWRKRPRTAAQLEAARHLAVTNAKLLRVVAGLPFTQQVELCNHCRGITTSTLGRLHANAVMLACARPATPADTGVQQSQQHEQAAAAAAAAADAWQLGHVQSAGAGGGEEMRQRCGSDLPCCGGLHCFCCRGLGVPTGACPGSTAARTHCVACSQAPATIGLLPRARTWPAPSPTPAALLPVALRHADCLSHTLTAGFTALRGLHVKVQVNHHAPDATGFRVMAFTSLAKQGPLSAEEASAAVEGVVEAATAALVSGRQSVGLHLCPTDTLGGGAGWGSGSVGRHILRIAGNHATPQRLLCMHRWRAGALGGCGLRRPGWLRPPALRCTGQPGNLGSWSSPAAPGVWGE